MMIRFACFGALFVALALAGRASATGDVESGVAARLKGLVSAMDGSKVCPFGTCDPATSQPSPPCGPYHRWSRQSMMCVPR